MIDYNKLNKSKIYVAFSQGDTWVSKLIRWATSSKFSHSFILYWDERYNSWLALGDDWNGWCLTAADTENTLAVATLSVDLRIGLNKNMANLGSFYDYPAFIGMAWVILGERVSKTSRQWANPLNIKSWFICSEICTKVIQDSGQNLSLLSASTHPQKLYSTLKLIPEVEFIE